MRILDRKFLRLFVLPAAMSLLICVFLFLLADLFGTLDDILEYRPAAGVVMNYVFYRFLYATFYMLPLVAMLGGFWGLNGWRESNQWTAVLNSGVAPLKLLRMPIVFLLLLTAVGVLFGVLWMADVSQGYRHIENYVIPGREESPPEYRDLHFRMPDGSLVKMDKLIADENRAEGIVVQSLENDELSRRLDAERGEYVIGEGWILKELEVRDFEGPGRFRLSQRDEYVMSLDPPGVLKQIMEANPRRVDRRPEEFTAADLRAAINFRERRGMNTTAEQVFYHWKYSYPLTILALGVLGIYVGAGTKLSRPAGLGTLLLVALIYWAFFHMVLAYAKADYFFFITPLLPASAPVYVAPLLFLGGGIYLLQRSVGLV